jgi:type III pantothenate kinase
MILLIDIGNTRIKWAQLEQGALGAQAAAAHGEDRVHVFERIARETRAPERILVSNVGGAETGELCARVFEQNLEISPYFVRSAKHAMGVTNAYQDPAKLGVDRWLAMIAAHQTKRAAVCVVSVGTAMTIDGVDASGQHLGGVIVPGPNLMISSLLKNTSDIASRMSAAELKRTVFADHTLGAVYQGCAHALAALIDRAWQEMSVQIGAKPQLLVTGGAAAEVLPLIQLSHEKVDDLVLRGLAMLARAKDPASSDV